MASLKLYYTNAAPPLHEIQLTNSSEYSSLTYLMVFGKRDEHLSIKYNDIDLSYDVSYQAYVLQNYELNYDLKFYYDDSEEPIGSTTVSVHNYHVNYDTIYIYP